MSCGACGAIPESAGGTDGVAPVVHVGHGRVIGAVQEGNNGVGADADRHGSRSYQREGPRADGDGAVRLHRVLRRGEIGHQRFDEFSFVLRPGRHGVVLELGEHVVGEEERVRECLGSRHDSTVLFPEGAAVPRDRVDDRAREDELPPFTRVRRRGGRAGPDPRPGAVARQRESVAVLYQQGELLRHRHDHIASLHRLGREQALAVRRLAHRRLVEPHVVAGREGGDPPLQRGWGHASLSLSLRLYPEIVVTYAKKK